MLKDCHIFSIAYVSLDNRQVLRFSGRCIGLIMFSVKREKFKKYIERESEREREWEEKRIREWERKRTREKESESIWQREWEKVREGKKCVKGTESLIDT